VRRRQHAGVQPVDALPLEDWRGAAAPGSLLRFTPAPGNPLRAAMQAGEVDWLLTATADAAGAFAASLPPTGPYAILSGGREIGQLTVTAEDAPQGVRVSLP